jgi:hypothetical protein
VSIQQNDPDGGNFPRPQTSLPVPTGGIRPTRFDGSGQFAAVVRFSKQKIVSA